MSEHLPECLLYDATLTLPCVCDRLRACEQRVLGEVDRWQIGYDNGKAIGYGDALNDAREAVAALPYGTGTSYPAGQWVIRGEALAAIDKLYGE